MKRDREMTTITLRVPVDVVETLKELAPKLGYSGYQPLIKAYVGEGLRRDEARLYLAERNALQKRSRKRASMRRLSRKPWSWCHGRPKKRA